MDLLIPTINQMIFLFTLIMIGFVLVRTKVLDISAASVLSKLENNLFIPALVAGTFINNFTKETFSSAWKILLFSLVLELILIPCMVFIGRKCTHDRYLQKICIYGLCFSNFGFMGNAVVKAIFPDIFTEYILFTLPLWSCIYLWGVPALLIPEDVHASEAVPSHNISGTASNKHINNLMENVSAKNTNPISEIIIRKFVCRLKAFINPMIIAMFIGMLIGISGMKLPSSIQSVITVSGDCMSPIAMLLTGITIGSMDLKGTLREPCIYTSTLLRLVVIPAIFMGLLLFIPVPETMAVCMICSLAMPLGLSTVVVPRGYGKDTSVAAGMALVSHLVSLVTIPVIFLLLRQVILL